jgi:hypothetical protein
MSLTTATPSTGGRAGSSPRRSAVARSGEPRLRIVRDEHRPVAGRPARPAQSYRSDLSVRSASQLHPGTGAGPSRAVPPIAAVPGGKGQGSPTASRRTAPVRLTRRGRIVVRIGSAGLVLLGLTAGVLLLDRTAEAGSTPGAVPVSYRVVLPGETLWQIAGEVDPGADRRDTVARIVELNALPGAGVAAGQRIAVPVTAGR